MSSVLRIVLPVVGVTCGLAVTIIWNAFLALELFRRFNLCFDRMAGLAMLSAAYYRHRAEVFRFALLTTSEPVAEGRLRTIVEKYGVLRIARTNTPPKAHRNLRGAPHFRGCGPVKCDDVAIGRNRRVSDTAG